MGDSAPLESDLLQSDVGSVNANVPASSFSVSLLTLSCSDWLFLISASRLPTFDVNFVS